jgi:hypothetical protein
MRALLWIVFLGLILAALPYVDGYVYKTQYLSYINSLNNNSSLSKNFKIEVQEYQLSWLRSHAIIHLNPISPQAKIYFVTGILLDDTIYHGPIAYNPTTHKVNFGFAAITHKAFLTPELQAKLLGNELSSQPILVGETIVSFTNVRKQNYNLSSLTIPNLGVIQPNHAEVVTSFKTKNGEMEALSIYSRIDTLALTGDKSNEKIPDVSIQSIIYNQQAKREMIGLWNLDSEIFIPALSMQWKNSNFLKLNFIQLKSQKGLNSANLYDAALSASINNIQMQYDNFPSITGIDFMLSVNNINPTAAADYYQSGQNKELSPSSFNDLRQNILTASSHFNLIAKVNTSLGRLSIQSSASAIPGNTKNIDMESHLRIAEPLLTQFVELALTDFNDRVGMMLKASAANPETASTPALSVQAQAKNIIDGWMSNGYLLREGNDLVSNLIYSPTEASINGKPILGPKAMPAPTETPPTPMPPPEATPPVPAPNTPPNTP